MKSDRLVKVLLTESKSELKVLKLGSNELPPENYTGIVEWPNGAKSWYLKGQLHREDGPAVEYLNGSKAWYLNDQRHREDGPAVEHASGTKFWYLNGQLHREDGPAVEYLNGTKFWYLNGHEVTEEEINQRKKLKELGGVDFDGILDI